MSKASVNKVILVGNLGSDAPELRYTSGGAAVVSFSLATNKRWRDKESGDKREKTAWHQIEAWNGLAENCAKYLKPGSHVYIEGELEYSTSEKDGVKRYWTKIKADDVQFLDK